MNVKRNTRFAITLASCALITAPAAQASPLYESNDTSNYSQIMGDDHARSTPASVATPIVALGDDHARSTSATVAVATPIFTRGDDHAFGAPAVVYPPHGGFPVPTVQTSSSPLTAASASGGFDWEDAGVGFGTAAGLALLGAGTLMSTRRLRTPRTSSV